MMCRIVSTSLLLAAGIAVSACNVTTSSVTAPKAGTPFKNGHAYDIESDGTLASVAGTQQAPASENGSGGSGGGASGSSAGGGGGNVASGGRAAGGQSSQRQIVSGSITDMGGGAFVVENRYSDGSVSGHASAPTTEDTRRTNRNAKGELDKDGAAAAAAEQASREKQNAAGEPDKDAPASTGQQASSQTTGTAGELDKDGAAAAEEASRQAKNKDGEPDKDA